MRISVSRLKLFKACRRAYELRYVHGVTPITPADALVTGATYHGMIEALYKREPMPSLDSREAAMFYAYMQHIFPHMPDVRPEREFEYAVTDDITLIGRVDGLTEGGQIVEHKTTSQSVEQYEFDLMWDEQILAYMLATDSREVLYTVCRKPTIRQRHDESAEEYAERALAWYCDDTDTKIRLLTLTRTDAEVAAYKDELIKTAREVADTDNYYRNTLYCTHWGRRCEYAPICLQYDPEQTYIGFERGEGR